MPRCNDSFCWFAHEDLTSRYICAVCGALLHFGCGCVPGATKRECWQCRTFSSSVGEQSEAIVDSARTARSNKRTKDSEVSASSSVGERSKAIADSASTARRNKRTKDSQVSASSSVGEQSKAIADSARTARRKKRTKAALMHNDGTTTTAVEHECSENNNGGTTTTFMHEGSKTNNGSENNNIVTTTVEHERSKTNNVSTMRRDERQQRPEYEVLLSPHVDFGIGLRLEKGECRFCK